VHQVPGHKEEPRSWMKECPRHKNKSGRPTHYCLAPPNEACPSSPACEFAQYKPVVHRMLNAGTTSGGVYLTNGRVAWLLGGEIGERYAAGVYRPPGNGWKIWQGILSQRSWKEGRCGEMRLVRGGGT